MKAIITMLLILSSSLVMSSDAVIFGLRSESTSTSKEDLVMDVGVDFKLYESRALTTGVVVSARSDIMYHERYDHRSGFGLDLLEQSVYIKTRRNTLVVTSSHDGFVVSHRVDRTVFLAQSMFLGGGVKVNGTEMAPTSVYADVGASIDLFGFTIETKYRVSSNVMLNDNGYGFNGGHRGQTWLTIKIPF